MEKKSTDLLNLPVLNLTSGSQLAKVKDIILNADDDSLIGFLIDDDKYLPFETIKTPVHDTLIIESEDLKEILKTIKVPLTSPFFLPEYIIGTQIVTEKGKSIGKVDEILIDMEKGKITGYIVSDGLLKDLVAGRSTITIPQVVTYGEDAVVIKES